VYSAVDYIYKYFFLGKKDLDQKSQIRTYPHNPRHPRTLRFDEYYFINPNNHTQNPANSISCCPSEPPFMKSPQKKLKKNLEKPGI